MSVYYKDVFDKWGQLFEESRREPEQRYLQRLRQIKSLPASQQEEILHDIHEVYSHRPEMAMVDSVKASPTCTFRATSSSTPRCRR
ncbi:NADP-dependent isocitrate dehydrogenase [Pseudomonas aeruginosa]|nr:NADP-dependent isocitrate dehydrogenase [Pseudomonas aeruginosa]